MKKLKDFTIEDVSKLLSMAEKTLDENYFNFYVDWFWSTFSKMGLC